jgi:hypothetical protein
MTFHWLANELHVYKIVKIHKFSLVQVCHQTLLLIERKFIMKRQIFLDISYSKTFFTLGRVGLMDMQPA